MKLSQINITKKTEIELPDTDARRLIFNNENLGEFIDEHGDLDAERPTDWLITIPSFEDGRSDAINAKMDYLTSINTYD